MDTLLNDVRYALRWMVRSPGFAAVAVLSLGLGVGVNTAMFSLVDSLLFRPLPVTEPGSLVDVFTTGGDGDEYATSSYADFQDLKTRNTVFSDILGHSPMMAPLSLGDRSRIALGQVVTSNHFTMLGVQPFLGRMLVPADDEPSAARVAVISHRMWQREFGGDQGVAGKSLTLRGQPYTIAGVAPASFTGVVPLLTPELWLPITQVEEVEPAGITDSVPSPVGKTTLERRGMRWLFIKGRLKPGTSGAQAHANVALIGTQLEADNPLTNKDRKMAAVPTEEVRLLVPQAGGVLSLGAPPRDQRAAGDWRQPGAADPATPGRRPAAGRARCRRCVRAGMGARAGHADCAMVRYEPARGLEFWRQALARVRAMPSVTSAGLVSPTLPFTFNFNQQELRVDNRTYTEGQRGEIIENVAISPGYLSTLGVPVTDGRDLDATDIAGGQDVAVINETMARKFWPNESAVGHTFQSPVNRRTYRIVGVSRDHKRHGVLEQASPFVYFAEAQRASRYNFLLARTSGDATALVGDIRRELLAMEPGLVFMSAGTMEQNLGLSLMPARVGAMLATAFGGLGTLLAAIGLVAGGLLAAIVAFALRGLLYGVQPLDPVAWAMAFTAMVLAAGLANFVPARRAMRIDPMTALRTD